MNSSPPNHDTTPNTIITDHGDLWLAPGVLPEEEPDQGLPSPDEDRCAVSDLSQWKGVRMGFNVLPYLLGAHELAKKLGCAKVNVAIAGIGRLIREYGVDTTEQLIASVSGELQGTFLSSPEQTKFLNRILELERIRAAVIQAAIETLNIGELQQRGGTFGVTRKLIDDGAWRKSFFEALRTLKADLEGNIDFYGDRLAFGSALERALPRRLRKKFSRTPEQPFLPEELTTELAKELDYLLEEGALAVSMIINQAGYYAVHRGGDLVDVPRRKKTSTMDCLRVAIAGRVGNVLTPAQRDSMFERWIVSEDLDGQGFFHKKGGAPERMTPYYWHPGKAGNSNSDNGGGPDETIMPFSPPLVPWEHGWLSRYVNSGSGGIAHGQPSAVFSSVVAPIMRHHLKHVMSDAAAHIELSGQYHGVQYGKLKEWLQNPNSPLLVPEGFSLEHVNDRIRAIAEEVGRRAWAILNPSSANATDSSPSQPVPSVASSGALK